MLPLTRPHSVGSTGDLTRRAPQRVRHEPRWMHESDRAERVRERWQRVLSVALDLLLMAAVGSVLFWSLSSVLR